VSSSWLLEKKPDLPDMKYKRKNKILIAAMLFLEKTDSTKLETLSWNAKEQ